MMKFHFNARSLGQSRRGVAQVEYCLIVVIIVTAAVTALDFLGAMSEASLTQVSQKLSDGPAPGVGEAPPAHADAASLDALAAKPVVQQPHSDYLAWGRTALLTGVVIALCASCWVMNKHRRRNEQEAETDEEREAQIRLASTRLFNKRQEMLRSLGNDIGAVVHGMTRVRHVMTPYIEVMTPEQAVEEATEWMQERKMHHLLVCAADGQLVGVISDRDLKSCKGRRASDVMTREPLTVTADSLLAPAVTLLLKRRISCLPVIDQGRVVGVLTSSDCMMALQCTLTLLQQVAEQMQEQVNEGFAQAGR